MMKLFSPSLLIVFLFILGGVIFKSTAPTDCATILPYDNLFVLTGDARRIPFAIRKMHNNPKTKLYIIGAGGGSGYNDSSILIESKSKTTLQNAVAIKKIVDKSALNRIVLITTVDHFNRAKYLVHNELPDTEIAACPVPLSNMDISKQLQRWTIEYVKYIGTLLGIQESE
jgi:uncharacterized SAM-binding protein YcdF (DUF218 family)